MTPELINNLNMAIASEFNLSHYAMCEMSKSQSMALNGFKRFFRYIAICRNQHAIKLQNFIVEYLVDSTDKSIIPSYTVSYTSNLTQITLLDAVKQVHSLYKNHIVLLKNIAKMAINEGEDYLMDYIEHTIESTTVQLSRLTRLVKKLTAVASDEMYVRLLDNELHCKYKEKELKRFNFKDDKHYKY